MASSSCASIESEDSTTAYSGPTVSRKRRQITSPTTQPNRRSRRTSERGKKSETKGGETDNKELLVESIDSEIYCEPPPLKRSSGRKKGSSIKSPGRTETERKTTGKRTRSSNSDSCSPPKKRQKTSNSESECRASSGGRKRPVRKVATQQHIDSGSSGPEFTRRTKGKSKTSKDASDGAVKSVERRRRTKHKKSEEVVVSDSDSSPTRSANTGRRTKGRGKSKLQHSDSEPVSKGKGRKTQPPKGRTEEVCVPTNNFYSLPPFPEFARLTMASEG